MSTTTTTRHTETVASGRIRHGRTVNHNETVVAKRRIAGALNLGNHNETVVAKRRVAPGMNLGNHNETVVVRAAARR
jgi:hypothetical protein